MHAGDVDSISGQGTKIQHATEKVSQHTVTPEPRHHTWESMCHQERFCMTLQRSCMLQDSTQPNKYMLKNIFKVSSRILNIYFRQSLHSEFIMNRSCIEYLNICCIIIDFFFLPVLVFWNTFGHSGLLRHTYITFLLCIIMFLNIRYEQNIY